MAHRAEKRAKLLRGGVLAALLIGATGLHQVTGGTQGPLPTPQLPSITFADLAEAQDARGYVAIRRRTVLESAPKARSQGAGGSQAGNSHPGNSGAIEESILGSLTIPRASASAATLERVAFHGEDFDADLLGVQSPVDASNWQTADTAQDQRFETHEAYLLKHSDFGIESVTAANTNYRLFVIGQGVRQLLANTDQSLALATVDPEATIGPSVLEDFAPESRQIVRIAVLPRRMGRASWILEVDTETNQVLLAVALDAAGVPLSVVETVAFEERSAGEFTDFWIGWWQPRRRVTEVQNTADLNFRFADTPVGIPAAHTLPSGYQLQRVHSVERDLSPERSAVLTYGDGIDQMFVVSTVQSSIPLASVLPNENVGTAFESWDENAILTFTDRDMAQFMFRSSAGLIVTVVGRIGHGELSSVATDLYRHLRHN
ncbi:MAG: hypothetical protein AAF196_11150 [Planctomycetota bacterium]